MKEWFSNIGWWFYRFYCYHLTPRLIKRSIRFWWQRRTRGWDNSETWAIDYSFYKWITPRLKEFRNFYSYPPLEAFVPYTNKQVYSRFNEKQQGELAIEIWGKIIDKMIEGFELGIEDCSTFDREKRRKIDKATFLFAKYLNTMWD